MSIPKAFVNVNWSFAIEPTEENILDFIEYESLDILAQIEYGKDSFEDLDEWELEEILRDWFVNTIAVNRDVLIKNNVKNLEVMYEDEDVTLVDDETWEENKDWMFID